MVFIMKPENSEESIRISFKISKELLHDFNEYSKSKGYQRRDDAIIDLIKKELDK